MCCVLLTKYYDDQIEVNKLGRECTCYLKDENYVSLVRTLGKIKLPGILRHSWMEIMICRKYSK
jgi:hypothetical protein